MQTFLYTIIRYQWVGIGPNLQLKCSMPTALCLPHQRTLALRGKYHSTAVLQFYKFGSNCFIPIINNVLSSLVKSCLIILETSCTMILPRIVSVICTHKLSEVFSLSQTLYLDDINCLPKFYFHLFHFLPLLLSGLIIEVEEKGLTIEISLDKRWLTTYLAFSSLNA